MKSLKNFTGEDINKITMKDYAIVDRARIEAFQNIFGGRKLKGGKLSKGIIQYTKEKLEKNINYPIPSALSTFFNSALAKNNPNDAINDFVQKTSNYYFKILSKEPKDYRELKSLAADIKYILDRPTLTQTGFENYLSLTKKRFFIIMNENRPDNEKINWKDFLKTRKDLDTFFQIWRYIDISKQDANKDLKYNVFQNINYAMEIGMLDRYSLQDIATRINDMVKGNIPWDIDYRLQAPKNPFDLGGN